MEKGVIDADIHAYLPADSKLCLIKRCFQHTDWTPTEFVVQGNLCVFWGWETTAE